MEGFIKLHNPTVRKDVHIAIKMIAVQNNATIGAVVNHLISTHPLVKAELAKNQKPK